MAKNKEISDLFIETVTQLFALGIFSVKGGASAWFELILMVSSLCACGYILWWQTPLLIMAVILGTLAAGMFSILFPQYLAASESIYKKPINSALLFISEYNCNKINNLSGSQLQSRLEQLRKAQDIIKNYTDLLILLEEDSNLSTNMNNSIKHGEKKVQEEIQWENWLIEERKKANFAGGCPPNNGFCRPEYPIKITLNNPGDGFNGIIWKPSHRRYRTIHNMKWCHSSVEEAKSERLHKLRLPKNEKDE